METGVKYIIYCTMINYKYDINSRSDFEDFLLGEII